jgi:divalent metal cation (Fe/Co/Zn/Cd) transporter
MMWGVWGLLLLVTIAVYIYQSRLARDEEDQIFLSDGFEHEKAHQTAIADKVSKVQPVLKICKVLVAVATVFVIGYYVVDVFNQFK